MITDELKQRVIEALAKRREHFGGSDAKFAVHLGISHSQYSLDEYGLEYEDVPDLEGMSIFEFMNRTAKVSAFQMFLSKANGFKNCSDVRLQARYSDKREERLSDEIFPN
jgi:hypothetical protein